MSVAGILLFGHYLEPLWGPQEFLRFTLLVNTLAATATFASSVFLYALTQAESLLYIDYNLALNSSAFSVAMALILVMTCPHADSVATEDLAQR